MYKPPQLKGIQCGRGLAAALVVLYHAGRVFVQPQYLGHPYFISGVFAFGNAGVDFFFVLSGFIICFVHANDIGRPGRLVHYAWQRITRIYPIYWVITLGLILQLVAKHDVAALAPVHVLRTLFLLPDTRPPYLGVAWTLTHEVAFYLLFAVAILSARLGLFVAALAVALSFIGIFHQEQSPILAFCQAPFHLEFALGVLAALIVKKGAKIRSLLWGTAGVLLFGAAAYGVDKGQIAQFGNVGRLLFGSASFLIILSIASLELQRRLWVPKIGTFFGAASYSIYLLHLLIVSWGAKLLFSLQFAKTYPTVWGFSLGAAAIICGCLLHLLVEKPLQQFVRGKLSPRSKAPAPASA